MRPDSVRSADTKAWLVTAAEDLRRVGILLAAAPPDTKGALFHAQQAVEKALKAFLTWHDVPFRRVHELDVIGGQCSDVDASLADLVDRADILTKYAWRFRYPGAPYEPALEEAQTALTLAREAMEAIVSRLPGEVKP
jgi:HEPN domain-containing protein